MQKQKIRAVAQIRAEDGEADITKVIASTNELARDGWVVEPSGLKTANFLRTASVCFNHDYEHPVATPVAASLIDNGDKLEIAIRWPPPGTSAKSDEVRALVKTGVLRAVSIGFMPLEMEPLDPKQPWDGQRVLSADLLETSFVAVPADTGAIVTQRSGDNTINRGDDSDDGREVYCVNKEDARPEDGFGEADRCQLPEEVASLRSAHPEVEKRFKDIVKRIKSEREDHRHDADNLSAKERARRQIAHEDYDYQFADTKHMKYGLNTAKDIRASWSYIHMPKNEKAYSASEVKQIEDRIIAAWKKKIDPKGPPEADTGDRSAPEHTMSNAITHVRRLTKKVADHLRAALKHHERAAAHLKALDGHHTRIGDQLGAAQAAHEKAMDAHKEIGAAIEAARSEPDGAAGHIERALKLHAKAGERHRAVREAHADIEGAHEDAEDAHEALARSCREARSAIERAAGDHVPGDEDDATQKDGDSDAVQVSDGTQQEAGSTGRSAEWRQRRVRMFEMSNPA